MRQPIQEIGRTLARLLLLLADGESVETTVVLPTELVLRDST